MIDRVLWNKISNEIIECMFSQFPQEARKEEEYENISLAICVEVYNKEIMKSKINQKEVKNVLEKKES